MPTLQKGQQGTPNPTSPQFKIGGHRLRDNGHRRRWLQPQGWEVWSAARSHVWRRVLDIAHSALTIGGVLAVPVTTLLAIIGHFMPGHNALQQVGTGFYSYGALWFILALCGAHLRRGKPDEVPAR